MSRVLLSGASGFIGSALGRALDAGGHQVVRLVRDRSAAGVRWDPQAGIIDRAALAETRPDIVINLAGEPIARRWTSRRRHRIRDSRVHGTRALADALAALASPPSVFISGSAIGYYGADRGDELLSEDSSAGSDFLARVALEWEQAAQRAAAKGIRVVLARTGIVLAPDGGALERLLPPFQLGAGGPLGSGHQWMSWISRTDAVRALIFLTTTSVHGPVNLVGPAPTRNEEFARTLGAVLRRPAKIPTPAFALELLFGAMAKETILASQRVRSKRLADAGFQFLHPRLDEALRAELTRSDDPVGR